MKDTTGTSFEEKAFENIEINDLKQIAKYIKSLIDEKGFSSTVLHLWGDMGSGKTTFTKILAKEFDIKEDVQSPTFTIMREYDIPNHKIKKLLHVDAYRFEKKEEGRILNLTNRLKEDSMLVIEWPERMHAPESYIDIIFKKGEDEDKRSIYVKRK